MRANEIFSKMTPEAAVAFLEDLHDGAPAAEQIALSAAAGAFRLRPVFLKKQPRKRQAEWIRQALARAPMAPVAEELLATYFLEYHPDLLTELLDSFGLEHDKGVLKDAKPAAPPREELARVVGSFSKGEQPERRALLLRAFAAQSAVDWPDLEAILRGE